MSGWALPKRRVAYLNVPYIPRVHVDVQEPLETTVPTGTIRPQFDGLAYRFRSHTQRVVCRPDVQLQDAGRLEVDND